MVLRFCPCLGEKELEDPAVLAFAEQPLGKALREGWLHKVSKANGQSCKVYVRLTAEAVAFYAEKPNEYQDASTAPGSLAVGGGASGPSVRASRAAFKRPTAKPLEVVFCAQILSLLGRAKGSGYLKIQTSTGWWELRSEPPQAVEAWVEAISARLQYFREASRRSVAVSVLLDVESLDAKLLAWRARRSGGPRAFLRALASRVATLCGRQPSDPDGGLTRLITAQNARPYQGKRTGTGALVAKDKLAEVDDPDLQEVQGTAWSDQAVLFLKACDVVPEELCADFSLTLRSGVPDGLKRLIWPLAAGAALYPADDQGRNAVKDKPGSLRLRQLNSKASQPRPDAFYKSLCTRAFGTVVPQVFQDPVPTFCQGINGMSDTPQLSDVVKHMQLLTSDGQSALRRLLWCTQLTSHSIDFCPFLPNLFATLLAFFDEAEAMMIVHGVIKDFEDDPMAEKSQNPRIVLSRHIINKQAKLFVREGKRRSNCPEAIRHLEDLGMDLHAMAVELTQDGLAGQLPFRAFCRVVGSSLREGSEVILKYGMALAKMRTDRILECKTVEEAKAVMENLGEGLDNSPDCIDRLTKLAFSMVIKDTELARVSSYWGSDYVSPKPDYKRHIFCRPRLFEPRGHVPDDLWEAIWSWVPPACRIFDPKLVYVPSTQGTSIRTCLESCKQKQGCPMIFFVYSKWGDIIGGFSPSIWVRTSGYVQPSTLGRWVEDAFVFRRLKRSVAELDASTRSSPLTSGIMTEVFCWTSRNEKLLMASEAHGLCFGGDNPAIYISHNLEHAETAASESFSSPVLLPGADQDVPVAKQVVEFEIMRLEVFALE